MTLFDESLFFVTSYDSDAQRPSMEQLAEERVPEQLFTAGQRVVVRLVVDRFCLGVAMMPLSWLLLGKALQALASAVEAEDGSFKKAYSLRAVDTILRGCDVRKMSPSLARFEMHDYVCKHFLKQSGTALSAR